LTAVVAQEEWGEWEGKEREGGEREGEEREVGKEGQEGQERVKEGVGKRRERVPERWGRGNRECCGARAQDWMECSSVGRRACRPRMLTQRSALFGCCTCRQLQRQEEEAGRRFRCAQGPLGTEESERT